MSRPGAAIPLDDAVPDDREWVYDDRPGVAIPVGRPAVTKFAHHFAEGDRVRLKENGRCGKLESLHGLNAHRVSGGDRCVVLLDSGHRVQCSRDELEPETWSAAETAAPAKIQKIGPAIPIDDAPAMVKAAGTSFKIGDRVKDAWGCVGKIVGLSGARADISYDNGIQGTVLRGYFKAE